MAKVYILTDGDFREFEKIIETEELKAKLKEPASVFANTAEGRILGSYHYHLISWMQKMKESK